MAIKPEILLAKTATVKLVTPNPDIAKTTAVTLKKKVSTICGITNFSKCKFRSKIIEGIVFREERKKETAKA